MKLIASWQYFLVIIFKAGKGYSWKKTWVFDRGKGDRGGAKTEKEGESKNKAEVDLETQKAVGIEWYSFPSTNCWTWENTSCSISKTRWYWRKDQYLGHSSFQTSNKYDIWYKHRHMIKHISKWPSWDVLHFREEWGSWDNKEGKLTKLLHLETSTSTTLTWGDILRRYFKDYFNHIQCISLAYKVD